MNDTRRRINMRKIIVLSFITLDGVMQAPGGPEEDTSGGFKYGGWTASYGDEVFLKSLADIKKLKNSKGSDIQASLGQRQAHPDTTRK
jgi:hypothetical protein